MPTVIGKQTINKNKKLSPYRDQKSVTRAPAAAEMGDGISLYFERMRRHQLVLNQAIQRKWKKFSFLISHECQQLERKADVKYQSKWVRVHLDKFQRKRRTLILMAGSELFQRVRRSLQNTLFCL